MSLLALLLSTTAASAPSVDWALARRTGPSTAALVLLQADRRLMAVCFDPDGLAPEEIARAEDEATRRPVWLYLGPRLVARGRIESFEAEASPSGPCAVAARARFEEAIPLVAGGDILWASTRREGSQPRRPLVPGALERGKRALPPILERCFEGAAGAIARGTEGGTYLGLLGEADGGAMTAIVLVPREGPASLVALEAGRLWLGDVLDPGARRGHHLALRREVEGARRAELWRVLPAGVERLGAEGQFR